MLYIMDYTLKYNKIQVQKNICVRIYQAYIQAASWKQIFLCISILRDIYRLLRERSV